MFGSVLPRRSAPGANIKIGVSQLPNITAMKEVTHMAKLRRNGKKAKRNGKTNRVIDPIWPYEFRDLEERLRFLQVLAEDVLGEVNRLKRRADEAVTI
jgi:hypothetical protein